MCEQLTMLAQESHSRFIAQCEHATIHIAWDNLTIRLRPADFLDLAAHVCGSEVDLPGHETSRCLAIDVDGIRVDFHPQLPEVLKDLVCLAVLQMDRPPEEANQCRALVEAPINVRRAEGVLSPN